MTTDTAELDAFGGPSPLKHRDKHIPGSIWLSRDAEVGPVEMVVGPRRLPPRIQVEPVIGRFITPVRVGRVKGNRNQFSPVGQRDHRPVSVAVQFPVFRDVALQDHRGGLPTMTADGEHVLGPAPGVPGLWVIGGCCVGGLSTAPVLGELLAEWIVRGRTSMDVASLAPDRVAVGLPENRLRELCRAQYAHHYWAPETMPGD